MTTLCISCIKESPERYAEAVKHFAERGVDAKFINAIHAETFGILSWRPYRKDRPGAGQLTDMAQVGLCLSHYMAWTTCSFLPDDVFMILEDDAEFPENWKERLEQAMKDVPPDWDILLIGNSNCLDKPKTQIKGEVYEVKYPFCTHAYLLSKKAVPKLLELVRTASMNIDLALMEFAYPNLKTFTLMPRLINQRGMDLMI